MDKLNDPKKVNEVEEKARLEREQDLEDLKTLLDTPAGKRFFRRFMEEGKIFCTTFTGNSYTYFNEGARAFALKYFNDICEAAPRKVAEIMVKEVE